MDSEYNKMIQILSDFNTICNENDIEYFLTGETLLYAYFKNQLPPKAYNANVLMTEENISKFVKVIENKCPEDKEIEYWGNSDNYPDNSVRFIDKNTLCFNVMEYLNYKKHGMYIQIDVLSSLNKKKNFKTRLWNAIKLGLTECAYHEKQTSFNEKSTKCKKAIIITKCIESFVGKKHLRKKMFEYMCSMENVIHNDNQEKPPIFEFYYKKYKSVKMSSLYFLKKEACYVENIKLSVPNYTKAFLKVLYPKRLVIDEGEYRFSDNSNLRSNIIIDRNIKYDEYFRYINNGIEDFKQIYKYQKKMDLLKQQNSIHVTLANKNWRVVKHTDYRFKLAEKYLPMKKDIIYLYNECKWDHLENVFLQYTEVLTETIAQKRTIVFDEELFDIYIDMLLYKGEGKFVNKLLSNIPKVYYEPLYSKKDCNNDI